MSATRARKLIEASDGQPQRRLHQGRVDRIAADILEGRWQLTHQPIAVDPSGVVIDGQHRLHAIAQAGVDVVPVLVAWDADPATFGVIDVGSARTVQQQISLAGYANANITAAVTRSYLVWTQQLASDRDPAKIRRALDRLSVQQVIDTLESPAGEQVLDALVPARQVATAVSRPGVITGFAVAVALIRDTGCGGAPDSFAEYVQRCCDGLRLDVGSPVAAVRRWMIGSGYSSVGSAHRQIAMTAIAIKGWNYYALGRPMQLAGFKPSVELLPVPVPNIGQALEAWEAELAADEHARAEHLEHAV